MAFSQTRERLKLGRVEVKGEAPVKYVELTPEKAEKVFTQHVLGGVVVEDCALGYGSERLS